MDSTDGQMTKADGIVVSSGEICSLPFPTQGLRVIAESSMRPVQVEGSNSAYSG